VQKCIFLLFVHGKFIFHLIFMGYFLMNSLKKSFSEKCIALIWNYMYYHFLRKSSPKAHKFYLTVLASIQDGHAIEMSKISTYCFRLE